MSTKVLLDHSVRNILLQTNPNNLEEDIICSSIYIAILHGAAL